MADWPDPAQPGFVVFFHDARADAAVLPEERVHYPLPRIEQAMREVLTAPDNFFGITDQAGTVLQFAVNEDATIHIDLPDPARKGSLVKDADLEECLALVRQAGPLLAELQVVGMVFETWG
ncbi:MAG: hypothetical protein JNM56_28050 [Planctomycetia bacterium]|nr:hypothetical protein [Planctomycetia bacterium]